MPVAAVYPWLELHAKLRIVSQLTVLLAVVGWIVWIAPFDDLLDRSGTPVGGDFVMYYTAGQVFNEGRMSELYDDRWNQARVHALFPELPASESWPYRYPPTVAVAMSPLARLPYAASLTLFITLQIALLTGIGILWWREFALFRDMPGWLWGALATPLVIEAVLGGQTSLLGLACITAGATFLRRGNDAAAGAIMALSLYKPNLLWLVIACCMLARPRVLLGFVPVTFLGIVVAVVCCGWQSLADYARLAIVLGGGTWSLETPHWKVHGLVPLFQSIVPGFGRQLTIALGLGLATTVAYCWRRYRLDERLIIGLLLGCNSLFNPYVPIYDLVLLNFAALLLAQHAIDRKLPIHPWQAQLTLGLIFFGPHLSQTLAAHLGVQMFPWALLALIVWYTHLIASQRKLLSLGSDGIPVREREMHDTPACPVR